MNQKIIGIIALAAAGLSTPALADDDFYLGAAVGSTGSMSLLMPTGRISDTNSPRGFTVYGGYRLSEHVDLEAGYTSFGNFEFGAAGQIDLSALHLAGKRNFKVSESWTLFGKLGVVRHTIDKDVSGARPRETSQVKPMFGVGASYAITQRVSADVELVDFGTVRSQNLNLKYRQARLGLKYSF